MKKIVSIQYSIESLEVQDFFRFIDILTDNETEEDGTQLAIKKITTRQMRDNIHNTNQYNNKKAA